MLLIFVMAACHVWNKPQVLILIPKDSSHLSITISPSSLSRPPPSPAVHQVPCSPESKHAKCTMTLGPLCSFS